MTLSDRSRLVLALLVLAVVTLLYLVFDESAHGDEAGTMASVAAITLSLTKVRIIVREFMDVRHAPRALRAATDALVLVMAVCLLATYLTGRAVA